MPIGPEPSSGLPVDAFIAELKRWRDVRGMSQTRLANRVGYTPSYVSKVENARQQPSHEFAAKADDVLHAGGALRRAYQEYVAGKHTEQASSMDANAAAGLVVPETAIGGLVVEHDDAELVYDGRIYRPTQRRMLYNAGQAPIARYLIRISVDRFPGNPERSNELYREHPLTWEELNLKAWHGTNKDPMRWKVQHDRDAFKEVWLLFENAYGRFPLYPGETTWIEYSYSVSDEKWGQWFQRAVRLPTKRLSVRLVFPKNLDPTAWGMETSMTAEAVPLRTAITRHDEGGHSVFSWSTEDPPLHARYRLEWRFRTRDQAEEQQSPEPLKGSQAMRSLGVAQEEDPVLRQVARPFDLPAEAEDARRVICELQSAMERVMRVHTFGKGVGIAAPQIGIDRAAAIVRPPGSNEVITLLNPRVVQESAEVDEQYEGCLSFFDVRGMVPRPLALEVEHQDVTGRRQITIFERGVARLVAHEIDHLHGVLYRDRMKPGVEPIPVSHYKGTGENWTY